MRANISINRTGWFYNIDHRKIILIAFLARFICAAIYDSYVSVTDKDILLPDSKFYSVRGRYISLFFSGYRSEAFTKDMVPGDAQCQYIFQDTLKYEGGGLPHHADEPTVFTYIIGFIYFVFGYFPFGVRALNIALSIGGAYLLFLIARRMFGVLTANLFLIIALFLPTQFIYSITLTRDFVRMFIISLTLWVVYG